MKNLGDEVKTLGRWSENPISQLENDNTRQKTCLLGRDFRFVLIGQGGKSTILSCL